jgi:hypothetical protein
MPYGFTSPGANAGNAILQELMQREELKRQQMLDQMAQQQRTSQQDQQQQELMLRAEEQRQQQERLAAQDAARAEAQQAATRKEQNTIGVRGMMADAMTQGPLTPDSAKTIGIMAFREGMDAPPEVQAMQTQEAEAQKRGASLADYEARQMIDASVDPRESERYRTVGGSIFDTETRGFMSPPEQGGRNAGGGRSGESPAEDYTARSQGRLFKAITDLEPQIGPNTVGTWRAKGSRAVQALTPGEANPTVNFDAALGQIKALIGFNELNQMRRASPTGGALGQVSERELAYLQSVVGALDPNQEESQFRAQLQKVKDEVQHVVDYGLGGAPGGRASGAGPGPTAKPTAADLIRKYGGGNAR